MKNQFSKLSVVAIIALLLFSGCKKETTKPAPTALTSTTTTVESTYFLQGNFGGETHSKEIRLTLWTEFPILN